MSKSTSQRKNDAHIFNQWRLLQGKSTSQRLKNGRYNEIFSETRDNIQFHESINQYKPNT